MLRMSRITTRIEVITPKSIIPPPQPKKLQQFIRIQKYNLLGYGSHYYLSEMRRAVASTDPK